MQGLLDPLRRAALPCALAAGGEGQCMLDWAIVCSLQVLGWEKPYEDFRKLFSRVLAQKLMCTMKVPIDADLLDTYIILIGQIFRLVSYNFGLHILSLQQQYVSEAGAAPGKLYAGFRMWVQNTYPTGVKWETVMHQDDQIVSPPCHCCYLSPLTLTDP